MPLYQDGLRKMRGILKDCKPNGGNNQPSDVTRQEFQDRNEQPRWCNRASTAQELLICRNPNLSYLDINFNRIFIAAWRDNKSLARSLSRQFRRQRKQCALDERCISDVYRYFSRELRVSRYQ